MGPVAGAAQVGGGTNAGWASLAGAGRAGTGRENRLGAGGPGRGVVGCCTNAIAVGEAGVPLRTPFAASFSTSFIAFVFPTILQDFAGVVFIGIFLLTPLAFIGILAAAVAFIGIMATDLACIANFLPGCGINSFLPLVRVEAGRRSGVFASSSSMRQI